MMRSGGVRCGVSRGNRVFGIEVVFFFPNELSRGIYAHCWLINAITINNKVSKNFMLIDNPMILKLPA